MNTAQRILIIDLGAQYTQLIARRVREAHVYCEIHPPTRDIAWIRDFAPTGIILSGGPSSVYDEDAPSADRALLDLGVPVLGICYGMQLLAQLAGGEVRQAGEREYGRADIEVLSGEGLFDGFAPGSSTPVWMCHGDRVDVPPAGWDVLAPQRQHAGGGLPPSRQAAVRRPVPSRGRAYPARRRDPRRTSCSASATPSRTGRRGTSSSAR